jgi:hypothetical protein
MAMDKAKVLDLEAREKAVRDFMAENAPEIKPETTMTPLLEAQRTLRSTLEHTAQFLKAARNAAVTMLGEQTLL